MTTTGNSGPSDQPAPARPKRPFFLTLVCVFAFGFFGLIALLAFIALFFSGTFRDLINYYVVGQVVTGLGVFSILLLIFALHGAAFAGVILMWRMKRLGYYLFGIPVLSICLYQLFQPEIPVVSTGIQIILLILFGIFYRRFH